MYHTLLQFFKTVRWGSPIPLGDRIDKDEDTLISTERPRLLLTASCLVLVGDCLRSAFFSRRAGFSPVD